MKTSTLLVVGGGAAVIYWLWNRRKANPIPTTPVTGAENGTAVPWWTAQQQDTDSVAAQLPTSITGYASGGASGAQTPTNTNTSTNTDGAMIDPLINPPLGQTSVARNSVIGKARSVLVSPIGVPIRY